MKKIIVANWKMQKTHDESVEWIKVHGAQLATLAHTMETIVVICPSFVSLEGVGSQVRGDGVALGAQDCSAHDRGAYTGEVSARALREMGCDYCIVGHSERRRDHHETDDMIAQKIVQLVTCEIIPIICVGEPERLASTQEILTVLESQLEPVVYALRDVTQDTALCMSYEPWWAIGSGYVPQADVLREVLIWLKNYLQKNSAGRDLSLLYGGSIDDQMVRQFKMIPELQGFLVGKASLDYGTFAGIITSWHKRG